jgi:hypothetical protein
MFDTRLHVRSLLLYVAGPSPPPFVSGHFPRNKFTTSPRPRANSATLWEEVTELKSILACAILAIASSPSPWASILYGGLGGHAIASGPVASANDGSLVLVSQTNASVTIVGHPDSVSRITGLVFDSAGDLFGSTLGGVPFPPPPAPSFSNLISINPSTGAQLSSVPITVGGVQISIADLALQPGSNVLYGVASPNGGTAPPTQLYRIDPATGHATAIGAPQGFFASIAFAPNGTLYESLADLDEATGEQLNPRIQVLNPATGAPIGAAVSASMFFGALAVRPEDAVLFGGTGDQSGIYRINPATGQATLIGSTGANFVGDLAFTPVPEPSQAFALMAGLLMLAGFYTRKVKDSPR